MIANSVPQPMIRAKAKRNLRVVLKKRIAWMTLSLTNTRPITWKITVTTINGRLQAQLPSQTVAVSITPLSRKRPAGTRIFTYRRVHRHQQHLKHHQHFNTLQHYQLFTFE